MPKIPLLLVKVKYKVQLSTVIKLKISQRLEGRFTALAMTCFATKISIR